MSRLQTPKPSPDKHEPSQDTSLPVASAELRRLAEASELMPEVLQPGEQYRLRPVQLGGYLHGPDYEAGRYIHVKILEGPNQIGTYKCTTFDETGEHLGPGGGWTKEHEDEGLYFGRGQLEPIPHAR